jgi:hypothetical protein
MPAWLSRLVDPPALSALLRRFRAPDLRLALRLCLPAALVAIALRAWLLAHMPAAFVHNDTPGIVETAEALVTRGAWVLDSKKTFLQPLVACIPALLHVPILPFLAVTQHLLGVLDVFLVGLLAFGWFRFWRWLIVPATLLIAVNPVLLWYEHTALAETWAVTGMLLVALAGTAFARAPGRWTFAGLLGATLFMAGARPEGRLFALFALALVIRVLWGNGRALRVAAPVMFAWTALLFALTRTGQGGLLLLTSVAQLAPAQLAFSPGLTDTLAPQIAQARAEWAGQNPPKLVPLRKAISDRIIDAQAQAGVSRRHAAKRVNAICARAGLEIAARNLPALPALALEKFLIAHRELPCGDFDDYAFAGQLDALYGNGDDQKNVRAAPLLWRRAFASEADARAFLAAEYAPQPALTGWLRAFVGASVAPLAPWTLPGAEAGGLHGVPWLYTAALLGLLALAARDRPLGFHQLWGAFLIGLWILIMVTANIRARFRVPFEPLWTLYALALLDSVLILGARWLPRRRIAA